jgi:CubicO group peptidase (beta-lactamase class C family)
MKRSVKCMPGLLAVLIAACATPSPARIVAPTRTILDLYAAGIQPGCAIGVFGPERRIEYRLSGYADLAAGTPITENTQFLIASASKQFTALAILHLEAQRRLTLDDPARRWVPELAGAVQNATIAQLLHQTAGVRDHTSLLALSGVESLANVDRASTLALMARQTNTNFKPGSRAQYSNGNYFVLSEIVERASGVPLERYAAKTIFTPLGMDRTLFINGGDAPLLAQGYQPEEDTPGFRVANDRPSTNGSGGVITTLADLAKFDADFRSERTVWSPRIKAKMLTAARLNHDAIAILPEFDTPYGMGLGLASEGDDTRIFHDGGAEGFRAEYTRLLHRPVSVAVLCNRVDARVSRLARDALRAAAGLPTSDPKAVAASVEKTPAASAPSAALLSEVAGRYRSEELDTTYNLRVHDGGFEVAVVSPFTGSTGQIETWGGMRLETDGVLMSGPLRLEAKREHGRVHAIALSFGKRAEGLWLERLRD